MSDFDLMISIAARLNDDRFSLQAEVDRLRAENERLRENVDRAGKEVERADRLRAEIARVKADERKNRAEIERLQDQNKLFRGALDFVAAYRALDFDPQKNLAASHMSIVAREALEGKP